MLKGKWPSKVPRYNKCVLLDEVFVIPGIIKVQVSVIVASADNTYRDLDYYIVFKKITANTPSQGT